MKLERVEIEDHRAIEKLEPRLDPGLTVFHGANGEGKTSVPGGSRVDRAPVSVRHCVRAILRA